MEDIFLDDLQKITRLEPVSFSPDNIPEMVRRESEKDSHIVFECGASRMLGFCLAFMIAFALAAIATVTAYELGELLSIR